MSETRAAARPPTAAASPDRVAAARGWAERHRWELALWSIGLVAGIALRWWILRTPLGAPDLDEATVGIQALQFNRGNLDTFFYNQAYGGTVETGLVAVSFRLLGSSVIALKLVPMALALVAAVLCRQIAVELRLSRTATWTVPVLVWCGPAYAVLFSTKERGFYGVALVLAAAYPLLVLRLSRGPSRVDMALLGACIGLGWWQSPLTMLVAVPAVLWLLVVRSRVLFEAGWAILAALAASLPWWAWNATHSWRSLDDAPGLGTTYGDRVYDWILRLNVVAGVEAPFDAAHRLVAGRFVGLALVGVVVAVAAVRTRIEAPGFLPTLVVGYGLLYALNTLAGGVGEDPRYVYLLVPVVAVAIGAVLPDPPADGGRFAVALAATAAAVGLTVWGLLGVRAVAERPAPNMFVASPRLDEVVDLLESRGVHAVITDTAGMQVAFLSDERVVGTSMAVPRLERYQALGLAVDPSTYVLDERYMNNVNRLRDYLDESQIGYEEQVYGPWHVFFVDRRVPPHEAHLLVYGGEVTD